MKGGNSLIQNENRLKVIAKDADKLAMKEAFAWNHARLKAYVRQIADLCRNTQKKTK
jgi:hypothetical protein